MNGTQGDGEWFFKRWEKGLDSDLLFDNNEDGIENWKDINIQNMLDDTNLCNGFIKILYHWSEDPKKDDIWYQKQCQELDDQRMINQELDLKFVGTQYCIFDDKILSQISPIDIVEQLRVPATIVPNAWFDIFIKPEKLDPMDYYLMGVDTASELKGAYNAIEVFTFRDFNQIAEFNYKVGSLNKYGKIVDFFFRWLRSLVGDRIIICFEKNSIGKAPIEDLLETITDINYHQFIYTEKENYPGISTTGISKEFMIGQFIEFLNENPKGIKSKKLYNQLSSIEKTHSGNIQSKNFTDMFMAACFCAMVRKKKALEIGPLLGISNDQLNNDNRIILQNIIQMNNPKNNIIKSEYNQSNMFKEIINSEDDYLLHVTPNDYKDQLIQEQIKILSDIF